MQNHSTGVTNGFCVYSKMPDSLSLLFSASFTAGLKKSYHYSWNTKALHDSLLFEAHGSHSCAWLILLVKHFCKAPWSYRLSHSWPACESLAFDTHLLLRSADTFWTLRHQNVSAIAIQHFYLYVWAYLARLILFTFCFSESEHFVNVFGKVF